MNFEDDFIPTDNVLAVSNFILFHSSSVKQSARIEEMVTIIRKNPVYKGQPVVFNEGAYFDFYKPYNNFIAATKVHASWGYLDYRMKDEKFEDGCQSIPVDWTINSERKKAFLNY